jgi:hypothetical protein
MARVRVACELECDEQSVQALALAACALSALFLAKKTKRTKKKPKRVVSKKQSTIRAKESCLKLLTV